MPTCIVVVEGRLWVLVLVSYILEPHLANEVQVVAYSCHCRGQGPSERVTLL